MHNDLYIDYKEYSKIFQVFHQAISVHSLLNEHSSHCGYYKRPLYNQKIIQINLQMRILWSSRITVIAANLVMYKLYGFAGVPRLFWANVVLKVDDLVFWYPFCQPPSSPVWMPWWDSNVLVENDWTLKAWQTHLPIGLWKKWKPHANFWRLPDHAQNENLFQYVLSDNAWQSWRKDMRHQNCHTIGWEIWRGKYKAHKVEIETRLIQQWYWWELYIQPQY